MKFLVIQTFTVNLSVFIVERCRIERLVTFLAVEAASVPILPVQIYSKLAGIHMSVTPY